MGFFQKKKIKNKRLNLHPFDFIGVEELRLLLVPISHLLLVFPCSCSPSRVFGLSVVAGPTSPAFCLLSHSHSSLSSLLLNLLSSPKSTRTTTATYYFPHPPRIHSSCFIRISSRLLSSPSSFPSSLPFNSILPQPTRLLSSLQSLLFSGSVHEYRFLFPISSFFLLVIRLGLRTLSLDPSSPSFP